MKTGFMRASALVAGLCLPTSQAIANPVPTEYRLSQTMTEAPRAQMAGNAGIVDCSGLQDAYQASGLPRGDSIETLRARRISSRTSTCGASSRRRIRRVSVQSLA